MTNRILARTCDTLLGTSSRITTGMRILPEPAPEVRPGALGVTLTGNAGAAPRQIDVEAIITSENLADLLSPADLSALRKIFARYSSTAAMGRLGQANHDAPDALTMGQHDAVASINAANTDFWAKRAAAVDR
jgi:hypothetical protein